MFKKNGLPVRDELVLCTVKRIHPHSAFVVLDEYKSVEGMLHISEVALRGVKNIKDYLSVGKKIVCKVMKVKGSEVDVSLKRVNSGARKHKLNEVRSEKRFYHLVEHVCVEAGKPELTDKIIDSFINKYGSLVNAFDSLKSKGLMILDGIDLPSSVNQLIKDSFESLLKQLSVKIKRSLFISSNAGDGVNKIKSLLTNISVPNGVSIDLSYLGSGHFSLIIEAKNYRVAEDFFNKLSNDLTVKAHSIGVLVSFSD